MKLIFKIAKTELRNLFYSPVAWFLAIAFLVQCAIYYTGIVGLLAKGQDWYLNNDPTFKEYPMSLTNTVFIGSGMGFFNVLMQNLYLFIPLLTMGMISKETNSGTVKLLYSSPVTARQIVLGKYLSILIYNFFLLLIMSIFIIDGLMSIKSPDFGVVYGPAIGFFLLIGAYTAIGMFMSSLTSYQIVSALATFLTFFVLSQIGKLWQQYDLVRDLTWFLSMRGRTHKMVNGLVTTSDVMYYLLIIFMFVSFTIFRLKGARESKPGFVKAARYLSVLAAVLIIGYATSRPGFIGYWDTTALQTNTIHEKTQKIIEELGDEPVEVTLYSNLLGDGHHMTLPKMRNQYVWDLWEKYIRFKPNLQLKYVYYYDIADGDSTLYKRYPGKNIQQLASIIAEIDDLSVSRYLTPGEIRKMIDLKPEDYRAVMQVKYKGRSAFLRTFPDPKFWPDESNIAAVLKRLAEGSNPKALFVTGNLERSIYKLGEREYPQHTSLKQVRSALVNHSVDCDTISLDKNDIAPDVDLLVLADPKVKLSDIARAKIRQFADKGGNMLIIGEPGKQEIVNPVLQPLGVQLMNGTLIEVSKNEMPHMVNPGITIAGTELAIEDAMLSKFNNMLKAGTGITRVLNAGVSGIAISDSGFTVKHLLVTNNRKAWSKVGKLVTDSAEPVFAEAEGDFKLDSFTTAVSLSRQVGKKEQRIIVCGDADFLSGLRGSGGNLGLAYYSWLVDNRYPIYMPRGMPKDVLMTISVARAKIEKIVFIWILPGLILLLATILLIRRKRQ
jgi:ABC-2 type transport system permease protein